MKKILSIVLAALMVISMSLTAFGETKTENSINSCNWMSVIKDGTLISDLSIPGTHDSATQNIAVSFKARCQNLSIPEQLNGGARFFDLRLSESKGKLKLVHNFISCRKGSGFGAPLIYFEHVISWCKEFLSKNNEETVIFFIKHEGDKYEKFDDLVLKYINENSDLFYTENRIPTLGEVRGKIVLMNRFSESNTQLTDKNGGINLTNFPNQKKDGTFQLCSLSSYDNQTVLSTYTVQDRYKLSKEDKWEKAIKPTLDLTRADGELSINFLSTASGVAPQTNAEYINQKAKNYNFDKNKSYGVVLFDFYNEELGKLIYSCNNKYVDKEKLPATSENCSVPKAENGKIPFAEWLWKTILKTFG